MNGWKQCKKCHKEWRGSAIKYCPNCGELIAVLETGGEVVREVTVPVPVMIELRKWESGEHVEGSWEDLEEAVLRDQEDAVRPWRERAEEAERCIELSRNHTSHLEAELAEAKEMYQKWRSQQIKDDAQMHQLLQDLQAAARK